jgi:nicotinamidase-related amidase
MPYPTDKDVPFQLDVTRTALLVVDMQNDFVREGAPLEVPDARATIPATQELITAARALGIPVIFTEFIAGPAYTLVWEWSPVLGPEVKCCWPGVRRSYGDIEGDRGVTDVIDELAPHPGEPIVQKYGYNAFHETNLRGILEARGRDMLVVAGTVTQICVEDTVRGAFHWGYRTVVAREAVSSYDPELHAATLKVVDRKYGRVLSNAEILDELGVPSGA